EEAATAQTALHFLFVLLVAHGVSLLWVQHFALSRTLREQDSGFSHLYSGNQLGVRSGLPAALLALVDQRRTLVLVVVGHLAVEAVVALVAVDVAVRMDRLDLAFHGAQLAGVATLLAPLEPVEQTELAGHRQGRAQRADVAAVDLAGEEVDDQQDHRVEHEPPLAVELQGDGGLERLHLGGLLGQHHGFQGDAEQHERNDVLDGPQAFVHREGQLELADLQLAGGLVDQLLQGAEGAQPAAEHPATPQQDAGGGEHPEDEDDRVGEEQLPAEVLEHRVDEGQHVDHRQLTQGIPADEHHGEDQVAATQPVQELRALGELVLQEHDDGQQAQGGA